LTVFLFWQVFEADLLRCKNSISTENRRSLQHKFSFKKIVTDFHISTPLISKLGQFISFFSILDIDFSYSFPPGVNFINILRTRFFVRKASATSYVQLCNFWCQHFVQTMLMKLAPGVNFINILCARFSYEGKFL